MGLARVLPSLRAPPDTGGSHGLHHRGTRTGAPRQAPSHPGEAPPQGSGFALNWSPSVRSAEPQMGNRRYVRPRRSAATAEADPATRANTPLMSRLAQSSLLPSLPVRTPQIDRNPPSCHSTHLPRGRLSEMVRWEREGEKMERERERAHSRQSAAQTRSTHK